MYSTCELQQAWFQQAWANAHYKFQARSCGPLFFLLITAVLRRLIFNSWRFQDNPRGFVNLAARVLISDAFRITDSFN